MSKLQKINTYDLSTPWKWLIGVDEVGRGPVAGPVTVCVSAVPFLGKREESQKIADMMLKDRTLPPLRDSKKLTKKGRNNWNEFLLDGQKKGHIHFALAHASAQEIDERGIAVCIRTLVNKNLKTLQEKLKYKHDEVLILLDGSLQASREFVHQETIIGGDDIEPIISFASIVAKVHRDAYMTDISREFPVYEFEKHKGYGTASHMEKIRKYGLTKLHRKTFLANFSQKCIL